MAFENDVFVSYAHLDNRPFEGEPGWISALHRALEFHLQKLLGREARIWRDPRLQGNDVLADTIVEQLPKVAVLVTVVSPPYVNSEWCRRELQEFVKASIATGGVQVADKMRVFKVVKWPVPSDQEPPQLQSMRGYDFYVEEPETHRMRQLGPMAPLETRPLYWTRVDDLAQDITALLTTLHNQLPHDLLDRQARLPTAGGGRGTTNVVYLAETSHDLKDRRDAIRRELQSRGYAVLPDQPLPLVERDCLTFVRAQLEQARLSIHMVGTNYGLVPDGSTESIVVLQHKLALERAGSGNFCRLIWMPPGLTTSDQRQLQFVAHLETDSHAQSGADLLQTPLEDFKTVLQTRLNPQAEPPAPVSRSDGGPKRVYVVCEQRDRETVQPLEDFFYSEGLEVTSSAFDGDEASVRRDHEENLVACDAVLIYYGAGTELWLRSKLRELQKSAGYGRTKPMLASAVFLAPPLTDAKSRFRSHEAVVINWSGALTPDVFQPFLRRLR